MAAGGAGDDEMECLGKCAAKRRAIAGECSRDFIVFEVPQLHGAVVKDRGGDRASAVTATLPRCAFP